MGQIKVLIADDEAEVLEIMARKVGDAGYAIVSARDGQEAWDKIRSEDPDVVVLDLIMPRLDGYAVLEKMRKEPAAGKWRPVIIVSAKGELTDIQKGFTLEADHYITKPCRMEDIIKGIRLMVKLIPQRKSPTEQEG